MTETFKQRDSSGLALRVLSVLIILTLLGQVLNCIQGAFRGRQMRRSQTTSSRLRELESAIYCFRFERRPLPDGTIHEVLEELERAQCIDVGENRLTEMGMDGWGRAFVYESRDGAVVIRSLGANGVDENGSGDDLQRVIVFRVSLPDGTRF